MAADVIRKRDSVSSLCAFLSAAFVAALLVLSCSPSESPVLETEYTESGSRPQFPFEKFDRAKSLSREGFSLYCSAMREEDQSRRDEVLERVLQEYYFPAQSIFLSIAEQCRAAEDAAKVDRESQDLSRKIDDVVRNKGIPRAE